MFNSKINSNGVNVRQVAMTEGSRFAASHLEDGGYRQGLIPVLRWANFLLDSPKGIYLEMLDPDQKTAFVGFFADGYLAAVARYDAEVAAVRAAAKRRTAPGTKVGRMFAGQFAR
jgi:hypothetical protein